MSTAKKKKKKLLSQALSSLLYCRHNCRHRLLHKNKCIFSYQQYTFQNWSSSAEAFDCPGEAESASQGSDWAVINGRVRADPLISSHLPLHRDGRWGTTDDCATTDPQPYQIFIYEKSAIIINAPTTTLIGNSDILSLPPPM